MIHSLQQFGDRSWTQDKLVRVKKYLAAYSTIMNKRNFHYTYIDGFAGTGYHELEHKTYDGISLFDESDENDVTYFLDGSARIALDVMPRFTDYIFIEKSPRKAAELEKLRTDFKDKADSITIEQADANEYLQRLCRTTSWSNRRAVLFLDPFGMQLTWATIAAVAKTKAIDTWILFPVSAVNRLLKVDGNIPQSWRNRLNLMFGNESWFDAFFPVETSSNLFDANEKIRRKVATMDMIGAYFNKQLATVFAGVAANPYTLRNSQQSPLFLLCFAAANPYAKDIAVKIAQDILKKDPPNTLFS